MEMMTKVALNSFRLHVKMLRVSVEKEGERAHLIHTVLLNKLPKIFVRKAMRVLSSSIELIFTAVYARVDVTRNQ